MKLCKSEVAKVFCNNEYMMHLLFLPLGTDPKPAELLMPILLETLLISLS